MKYRLYLLTILTTLLATATLSAAEPTREIHNLNDGWHFFPLEATDGDNADHVQIPHSWQCELGSYGRGMTDANYTKELEIPKEWEGKRLFLRFGAVQSVADLFVNGSYVGSHKGGFTAFTMEITDKVRYGAKNYIRVVVSNARRNDIFPLSSDMDLTGGILHYVELLVTPKNIISPLHHSSDGVYVVQESVNAERAAGHVRCVISATTTDQASINIRIINPDGAEIDNRTMRVTKLTKERIVDIPYLIPQPALWAPYTPNIYRVEVTLNDGSTQDMVSVETGFRNISISEDNRLCINGKAYDIHGVNYAHDRIGVGMATEPSHLKEDFATIFNMGANAIRSLYGPHNSQLYDLCDRIGLITWVDIPFTRSPIAFSDICYYPSAELKANGIKQLEDIIYQNYNHPSIAMWGLFNLVWQRGENVEGYIHELNDAAHTHDPSRLTVGCSNSDGAINLITDLIVLRQDVGYYKGNADDIAVWCRQLSDPRWSDMRFGICFGEEGDPEHITESIERATRDTRHLPERRQTYLHERYMANIENEGNFWGIWLDNMFDYASVRRGYKLNQAGLVEYDHEGLKDSYYLYRAKWNKMDGTLHIPNRRWRERRDTLQFIDVYSSVGTPIVVVNSDTVSVRRVAEGHYSADSVVIRDRGVIEVFDSLNRFSDKINIRIK